MFSWGAKRSNGETGLLPTENTDVDERSDSMNLSLINKTTALNSGTMDGGGFLSSVSKRKDLPDDLACFLQQQKQRQARLETTMRSFPSTGDMEQDKMDQKKKRSTHEDPMSHRIIEKRRRDRMNNCLADLSRLIPSSYLKKGRGRIEKTEIIEMAIKHIRHLQSHPCTKVEGCELAHEIESGLSKASSVESFRVGYHECLTETMHFLVEKEGLYAGNSFCVRLMTHLQKHFDKLGRASTSEIFSVVGRTWPGTNLPAEKGEDFKDNEDIDREAGVKSEFGISSEESGYKTDEIAGNSRETCAEDPELPLSYSARNWHSEAMTSDLPSDLSLPSEVRDNKHVEDLSVASSLYKFKSTIRHRFDSNRSCDDEFPMKIPEKRSRLDSTSTDRDADHSFDVDLTDTGVRRDSYSPGLQAHCRHESGPGPGLLAMSDHRHKSGAAEDFKIRSTSPIPGPSASSTRLPVQYIPVFALSTKGSYYIPLSVEASSLGPFVPFLTENNSGPCHPITISVKFSNFPGSQSSLPPMMPEPESPGPERPEPEWRNVRGQGGSVIHSQQSVIKNWRDQT